MEQGLEDLDLATAHLTDLYRHRDAIDTYIEDAEQEQRELVADLLGQLQDELTENEEVTLLHAEESSRGGHYVFREVLTSEGVVAKDVRRITRISGMHKEKPVDSSVLYDWAGKPYWRQEPFEEPLDIETEYLTGPRNEPAYITQLADRLEEILSTTGYSVMTTSRSYD